MAELPDAHFRPERTSENSATPHFFPNLNYNQNPQGAVGMFQPNNPNLMHTFVPHSHHTQALQQGEFLGTGMSNSSYHGPSIPPYVQYSQWPSSWNTPGSSSYYPGVNQGGVYSNGNPAAVIPFDRSIPPPIPRITVPPNYQQGISSQVTPRQRCIPSQVPEVSEDNARKFPGSLGGNDQEWIDSWLCHHPREVTSHSLTAGWTKKTLKVWEVKQLLQSCLFLLGEVERLGGELREGFREMNEAEWEQKLREAEAKKVLLTECLEVFDEEVMSSIKSALLKRRQKRARLRGRRIMDKELVAARAAKQRQRHLEVDMWLEGKQAEVDLHKREEMLKQEADAVLWEVRRKQSEGRRTLSLLSALVKLHQVRVKKSDPASNPALSENEDQFQIIIDKLSSLWERQMSEYDAEERALRVMLRERPEDGRSGGVGGSKGRNKATGDLQRNLHLWESLLFGTGVTSEELSSLGADSCQWLYLQPSKSLESLIENRRQWDQFLSDSPLASSIPPGWVIPAEASSEEWKALIGFHVDFA